LRAGDLDQAITLHTEVLSQTKSPPVLQWLALALAHHRKGEAGKAREWFARATTWFDREMREQAPDADTLGNLHVHDWLEAQLLRREVEAALVQKP
jgi:hypothetical protein